MYYTNTAWCLAVEWVRICPFAGVTMCMVHTFTIVFKSSNKVELNYKVSKVVILSCRYSLSLKFCILYTGPQNVK